MKLQQTSLHVIPFIPLSDFFFGGFLNMQVRMASYQSLVVS